MPKCAIECAGLSTGLCSYENIVDRRLLAEEFFIYRSFKLNVCGSDFDGELEDGLLGEVSTFAPNKNVNSRIVLCVNNDTLVKS